MGSIFSKADDGKKKKDDDGYMEPQQRARPAPESSMEIRSSRPKKPKEADGDPDALAAGPEVDMVSWSEVELIWFQAIPGEEDKKNKGVRLLLRDWEARFGKVDDARAELKLSLPAENQRKVYCQIRAPISLLERKADALDYKFKFKDERIVDRVPVSNPYAAYAAFDNQAKERHLFDEYPSVRGKTLFLPKDRLYLTKRIIDEPLMEIRSYYGEKIALYFAWLSFYGYMLMMPAIAERDLLPPERRFKTQTFSVFLILIFIAALVTIALVIFKVQYVMLYELGGVWASLADYVTIFQSLLIQVMSYLYGIQAEIMNNHENYQTQTAYENNLITKKFCFEIFNNYSALAITAFFKGVYFECTDDDCLGDLYSLLRAIEYFMPPTIEDDDSDDEEDEENGKEEKAAEAPRSRRSSNPPTTLKMTPQVKRPTPMPAETVGSWGMLMESMGLLAVYCNSAIIVFTTHSLNTYNLLQKVIIFFALEQVILRADLARSHRSDFSAEDRHARDIDDEPTALNELKRRQAFVVNRHKNVVFDDDEDDDDDGAPCGNAVADADSLSVAALRTEKMNRPTMMRLEYLRRRLLICDKNIKEMRDQFREAQAASTSGGSRRELLAEPGAPAKTIHAEVHAEVADDSKKLRRGWAKLELADLADQYTHALYLDLNRPGLPFGAAPGAAKVTAQFQYSKIAPIKPSTSSSCWRSSASSTAT
ncbi:intracellular chloride channel [Aureococcus anophagefferens]|uniref:Intracellular chloride channel n=1 Tax=Aureococcus anophagefferens TaxID=44056 RepID=A0ABR1FX41_AURAN